jgi:hypothetical protein
LRFSGEIRVEHYRDGEIVDQHVTDDAIWELMYLGHARASQRWRSQPERTPIPSASSKRRCVACGHHG